MNIKKLSNEELLYIYRKEIRNGAIGYDPFNKEGEGIRTSKFEQELWHEMIIRLSNITK